jgi:hypothetical protein
MQTRRAGLEGIGEIRLRELVKQSLRMRPSRMMGIETRVVEVSRRARTLHRCQVSSGLAVRPVHCLWWLGRSTRAIARGGAGRVAMLAGVTDTAIERAEQPFLLALAICSDHLSDDEVYQVCTRRRAGAKRSAPARGESTGATARLDSPA